MKTNTLKTIINAFNCVSSDRTKYHINFVCIRSTDTSGFYEIIATDGYKMSMVTVEEPFFTHSGDILIHSDKLPQLKLIFKSVKKEEMVSAGLLPLFTQAIDNTSVTFPSRDAIANALIHAPKQALQIRINIKYLTDLAKALDNDEMKLKGYLTLNVDLNTKNYMYTVQNGETHKGYLMGAKL